jgi:drug/metabolite transporter (DMT)-like permease
LFTPKFIIALILLGKRDLQKRLVCYYVHRYTFPKEKVKKMNKHTIYPELTSDTALLEVERPHLETANRRIVLGVIMMALAGVAYGFQAPLIKWAYANGVNAPTMLTLRFTIATVGVWALLLVQRVPLRQPPRKVGLLLFLGGLYITNSLFYYLAMPLMAAGTVTLLIYSFPALVVLWSTLIFKEPLGKVKLIALALSLLGCILTVDPVAVLGATAGFSLLGALYSIGSGVSNSWYMVLAGHYGRNIPGLVAAAYGLPVTAAGYILWDLIGGGFQMAMSPAGWACCLAIGLATAFAIVASLIGLSLAGPSRGAMTSTTEPAVVVLLGILLLGEELSLVKLVGGVLIMTAIVLLSRSDRLPPDN